MKSRLLSINKEYDQYLDELTLFDDDFMSKVFEDEECALFLLKTLIPHLPVSFFIRIRTQLLLKNLQGRDIQLDLLLEDVRHNFYNIEVQKSRDGTHPKRARYHGSIIDANMVSPQERWYRLRNIVVIFITMNGDYCQDKPIYAPSLKEGKEKHGIHYIYVNGTNSDERTRLGKLMHDFRCKRPEDMYYDILAKRVSYFKREEKGRLEMCEIWDKIRQKGIDEEKNNVIQRMLKTGRFTYEDIALSTGMSIEYIKHFQQNYM